MNDLQLLGPRAYGEAGSLLKGHREDFQVDEVLDIPPVNTCGCGWKSAA